MNFIKIQQDILKALSKSDKIKFRVTDDGDIIIVSNENENACYFINRDNWFLNTDFIKERCINTSTLTRSNFELKYNDCLRLHATGEVVLCNNKLEAVKFKSLNDERVVYFDRKVLKTFEPIKSIEMPSDKPFAIVTSEFSTGLSQVTGVIMKLHNVFVEKEKC